MSLYIAIDPGESGAIAYAVMSGAGSPSVGVVPMLYSRRDKADFLINLIRSFSDGGVVIYLEKTGTYRPGNSGPSAVKFARHCGQLEGIITGLQLIYPIIEYQVSPGVWMKKLGALPKDYSARKRKIKELMQQRFPTLTPTLKTADALGLLSVMLDRDKPSFI